MSQGKSNWTIRPATPSDAPSIGRAVCMGVGEELCASFAGANHTSKEVEELFSTLAARTDSQYSYLNSLILCDEKGKTAGVAVGYDGARLHQLREAFFSEAKRLLNYDLKKETFGDETTPGEYYLDTLAVWPEFRGQGGATALIDGMNQRAQSASLPLGLLVDKKNDRARRLYEAVGFVKVGERPFASEIMDNLRLYQE